MELPAGWLAGIAVLAAACGMACAAALLAITARVRQRRDLRDIVAAIEEIRSGKTRSRVELEPGSELALVADAVNRLGQDVGIRLQQAEHADDGLRAILETAREYAVLATDPDWDIRALGGGAPTMFGWESDALVGRSLSVLFDDTGWKDILPKLARRNLREKGIEGRYGLRRKDGSTFPARVTVRPTRPAAGDATGFVIVVQDVTAETRLEAELRASEERYRRLVEGLPAAVAVLRGGLVVYGNAALGGLFGLSAAEVAGLRLRDRVATSDVLVFQDAVARLERAQEGESESIRLTLLNGGGLPAARVRAALTSARHDDEAVVLAVLFDETAERRLEAELRHNEARLDEVVEAAAEGLVVVADAPSGGVVRMTNRAFLEFAGLEKSDVLGLSEDELVRRLTARGEPGRSLAGLILSHPTDPARVRIEAEDGRAFEAMLAPLRGRRGALDGRVLVLRDLSATAASERSLSASADALRRGKEELEAAYREMKAEHEDVVRREADLHRVNEELRRLDAMKSDLLASMSHELQTPLVSIRGFTEMILKGRLGPVNAEQTRGLELSLRNIDRLIGLIDNLLALARMEREVESLHLSVFPLEPLVDEAVELLREATTQKGVQVSREFADGRFQVRADRDKIVQVFLNLLGNAVKFNRQGGRIDILVQRGDPGFATIEIHDTGMGIAEEELASIFDRYYQAAGSPSGPRRGSGIGLAVVQGILRLHGCSIEAKSRLGEGTSFRFTLPLAVGPAEESPSPRESPVDSPPAPSEVRPSEPTPPASTQGRARFRIIRRS
ncbi:MAG TPA: PAS domain S-box protein [Candidatus Polarisedimenticolaceae bacterium]